MTEQQIIQALREGSELVHSRTSGRTFLEQTEVDHSLVLRLVEREVLMVAEAPGSAPHVLFFLDEDVLFEEQREAALLLQEQDWSEQDRRAASEERIFNHQQER